MLIWGAGNILKFYCSAADEIEQVAEDNHDCSITVQATVKRLQNRIEQVTALLEYLDLVLSDTGQANLAKNH